MMSRLRTPAGVICVCDDVLVLVLVDGVVGGVVAAASGLWSSSSSSGVGEARGSERRRRVGVGKAVRGEKE